MRSRAAPADFKSTGFTTATVVEPLAAIDDHWGQLTGVPHDHLRTLGGPGRGVVSPGRDASGARSNCTSSDIVINEYTHCKFPLSVHCKNNEFCIKNSELPLRSRDEFRRLVLFSTKTIFVAQNSSSLAQNPSFVAKNIHHIKHEIHQF